MEIERKNLTKKEFVNYYNKSKQGDHDALNYLMNSYAWIVDHLIDYFHVEDLDKKEELKSVGLEYLWKALKNFDFDRSSNFIHYATTIIKNRFINELKAINKPIIDISLTDIKNEENYNKLLNELYYNNGVEETYIEKQTYLTIRKLIETLPPNFRFVIENYFDLKKLSEHFCVSRSSIYIYRKRALKALEYKLLDEEEIELNEKDEREYNLFLRNNPRNIYDLFIQKTTGKRLDNSIVDLIFYFITMHRLKEIKQLFSEDLSFDKRRFSKIRCELLATFNTDDIYNKQPNKIIIKYLNRKIKYIHRYFRDLNTGRVLNEKIVEEIIKDNINIKYELYANGLASNLKNVIIKNIDNWYNIRTIVQQTIINLKTRLNTDIFALTYEEFFKLYYNTYSLTLK